MEIFQIIAIAIVGALLAITIKPYRAELAVGIGLVTGCVVIFMAVAPVSDIFSEFSKILEKSGMEKQYIAVVVKIIGIAYVTQFTCEILKDSDARALAAKVEFAGKMCVMAMTMPIIAGFLELVEKTFTAF